LAVARRLQQVDGARVVLIEKHGMVGSETSSRNSEVRHIQNHQSPSRDLTKDNNEIRSSTLDSTMDQTASRQSSALRASKCCTNSARSAEFAT
jgi:L-2-hydroxyglutarate oxidase LhgO